MPLEPIEESDLDLRDKFLEKKEATMPSANKNIEKSEPVFDRAVERKEGVVEKDDTYSKIVSKIQAPSSQTAISEVVEDATHTGKLIDTESKINNLIDIAMQKGVFHAAKVAKHMDDNYVLDEFHDKLMMDEFHDALVKKGLIKDM
ncbi:MAG: hypothetical protein ACD_15C00073G0002 [uncultured bacterium]|nr:MAG: hypothetical protein ACD_15C00073G0002 [uncultured bacterium]HCU71142.1 hypothetical protein [Candidatus Moranbacteria bacterium]